MPIEYLGLDRINGPLVVLEGCRDAFYEEIVEFVIEGNRKKLGKIIELYEDKAIIQVFDTQIIWGFPILIQGLRDIPWKFLSPPTSLEGH